MPVIGALLAVAMMLTVATGTALAEEKKDDVLPSITFALHGYTLWYSKPDVEHVSDMQYTTAIATFIGSGCGVVPNWAARASCAAIIAVMAASIHQTLEEAAEANRCVWITAEWLDLLCCQGSKILLWICHKLLLSTWLRYHC